MDVHVRHAAVDQLLVHRLSHDVRRVVLARPLAQLEVPGPHACLDPELPRRQMPHPSDPGPAASAD
eukprot:15298230-Alexandrium_andersonii.AAC.1